MPDVMGARIAVPAELETSGPRILTIAVALSEEISMLRNLLGPLADYWTGQASQGHEEVQAEWNTASTNLMTDVGTLGALSHACSTNWTNYVDCEAANTATWHHGGRG
ncbi:MAG: hypothetical protein QOE61_478 [Micromonosporaceae bacterium]|jgi:uncharacterized protein YukE|nr:hypothetical protein [Micromonosporaceae bacterium]